MLQGRTAGASLASVIVLAPWAGECGVNTHERVNTVHRVITWRCASFILEIVHRDCIPSWGSERQACG